jgi:hypothetical protein
MLLYYIETDHRRCCFSVQVQPFSMCGREPGAGLGDGFQTPVIQKRARSLAANELFLARSAA